MNGSGGGGGGGDQQYSAVSQIPPVDVDEALQYTPLSSVVPFAPDMISMPVVTPAEQSSFQSEMERQASHQALDLLNRHAEVQPDSKFVTKYFNEVSSQLSTAGSTEFRFKSLKTRRTVPGSANQKATEILRQRGVGRFAQMIVGNTSVPYCTVPVVEITVPVTSRPSISISRNTAPQTPVPPTPVPPTPVRATPVPNSYSYGTPQAFATPRNTQPAPYVPPTTPSNGYRATFQVQIPVLTPARTNTPRTNGMQPSMSPTPPLGSQVAQAVVIKSPQIDRSEYVRSDTINFKKSKAFGVQSGLKKRKRYDSDADDDQVLAAGVDQRAKADNLLAGFQAQIDAIFQAEDDIRPDTSGGYEIRPESAKFWIPGTTDGDSPCLSTAVQTKLESSIKKVISVKRFAQIPMDDLTRLEKLCENSIKTAESQRIIPSSDQGEAEMEDWLSRVNSVDNGLKSAKSVLRIMLGGRDEKQIYSEDVLGSVLFLVKELIENALNPMIEMRSGGDQPDQFKAAFLQKKILGGLLHEVTRVLSLFSQMVANEEATESAVTSALYMAASIVFIENANNEKDSIFGLQRVEMFRLAAMDILTKVFARYPDQQSTIFEQILQNLEKLPVNRASARQFKLIEGGKNIQLVSALIMRLIQTSGTYQPKKRKRAPVSDDNDAPTLAEDSGDTDRTPDEAIQKLRTIAQPLVESAQQNCNAVVSYLVSKALTSTKSGDQPYRHLLDIFTEDFLAVLGSPEWPAAELLLRCLLSSMCQIVDADKQAVTAKTMALDMLGLMGSGICDLVVHLRESHRTLQHGDDSVEAGIPSLTDKYLDLTSNGGGKKVAEAMEAHILEWRGPFRVALEHLFEARLKDSTLRSACGYYLTVWSSKVCNLFDKTREDDEDTALEAAECASDLRKIAVGGEWDDDLSIDGVSQTQIRQAYALTVLNMPFCLSFENLFHRLLKCVDDNQAQSRSKSMKSISQLLAKDPTILNRTQVIPYIMKKAEDASPLVRDSAVDLLGKCINIKPELEDMVSKTIVARSNDTGVAVRKRSMKILTNIYLHTKKERLQILIAEALIQRIKDGDSGVAEQAKKTFEDIWIAPFYSLVGDDDGGKGEVDMSPKLKQVAQEKVSVIVKVVQKESTSAALLEVIRSLLQEETANKNSSRNFRVCKTMVASMFDDLLNRSEESDRTDRENTIQALTVFAKANPKLLSADQLILLQPYIENLTTEDLPIFRSVIVIYRFALSILSNRHSSFLKQVQGSLLKNLSRLPGSELSEVISCLKTISIILNQPDRLIKVTISCLTNILKVKGKEITDQAEIKKTVRFLHLLGLLGHFCDFEEHVSLFKQSFPQWKQTSVSGLITDTILPFCGPTVAPAVRKAAVDSLGRVCQTHAPHFLKPQVLQVLDQVFGGDNRGLWESVLTGFKGYLVMEESRAELSAAEQSQAQAKAQAEDEPGRLTVAAYANPNDGVSTSLSQKYLSNITTIATGSQDGIALVATEVIASILRQGLVHPKECLASLVALETSTVSTISQIAYREHRTLHSKYESLLERGYMEGVRTCFIYQRNVVGDAAGATLDPYTAKLRPLYEIVREGNRKMKKRFLNSLVSTADFELAKLDIDVRPSHLEYAKFVIENLAFMDYAATEDLFEVVSAMEKVVAHTGLGVAHSIESEVFHIKLGEGEDKAIDPQRLKVLSSGSAILMMMWAARTYLRKAYGVNENKLREYKKGKTKANDPLMNRAPGKSPNVNANVVWDQMTGNANEIDSTTDMEERCRQFVQILSVDSELKVDGDDEDDLDGDSFTANTPEASGDEGPIAHTPKGRKRKGSAEAGDKGGKRKKANPSKRRKNKKDD